MGERKKILVITSDPKKVNRFEEKLSKKGEYECIHVASIKEAGKFLYKLDEKEQVVKAVDLVVTTYDDNNDTQAWAEFASQLTGVLTGIRIPHLLTSLA